MGLHLTSGETPSITGVRMSGAGRTMLPLLVLGPVFDSSALNLWSACAAGLTDAFDVLAWDLPGQGYNTARVEGVVVLPDLARGVLSVIEDVLDERGESGGSFAYAGGGIGGSVGLQLLLDHPGRVAAAVLIGSEVGHGPEREWLAAYDVRERVSEVRLGCLALVPDVSVLGPVEEPDEVAALLRRHLLGEEPTAPESDAALDERTRALVTVAALVAAGRTADLAALLADHRVEPDEVREVLDHVASVVDPDVVGAARAVLDLAGEAPSD